MKYRYIDTLINFFVLWHINLHRLFNAKESLSKNSSDTITKKVIQLPSPLYLKENKLVERRYRNVFNLEV